MHNVVKKWIKAVPRLQTAQGIVEFALVLPILLLLILGIIAFGHLFFVYTMTVSASREAARFGAAVGATQAGIPRYRDCTAIRQRAQDIGGIVGITPATVQIVYDQGPRAGGLPPVVIPGGCPIGGQGPEASLIRPGDRIVVTVSLAYTPIVPFVNLPSFPITAETARTIVKALPVGEAPVAEDPCTVQTTLNWLDEPNPSYVGQGVPIVGFITTADNSSAPGTLTVSDTAGHTCSTNDPNAGLPAACSTFVYNNPAGDVITITWEYVSSNVCYPPQEYEKFHTIQITPTRTTIISHNPDPSSTRFAVPVEVLVDLEPPLTGLVRNGTVEITDGDVSCTATLDPVTSRASCNLPMRLFGMRQITASYQGVPSYYSPSSAQVNHTVLDLTPTPTVTPTGTITLGPTLTPTGTIPPTRTPTPTITNTPTITPTPTKTPLPAWCPSASAFNFADPAALLFTITNRATSTARLTSVFLEWPDVPPSAKLQELRYSTSTANSCADPGNPSTCLWESNPGIAPPTFQLGSGGIPFPNPGSSDLDLAGGESKQMRFVFSRNLHNGRHYVTLRFDNNCILELRGERSESE